MADKKEKKGKKDQKKLGFKDFKLLEGTALKNLEKKKGDDKTAIYVKNWHLEYEMELKILQIELMKLQQHMQETGDRELAIFGRRVHGTRICLQGFQTSFLNPRNTRVVALTKPNETEATQWYFQRYTSQLPSAGEGGNVN